MQIVSVTVCLKNLYVFWIRLSFFIFRIKLKSGFILQAELKNGFGHDEIIELIHSHSKQHHILKELLDTERLYVSEIKSILRVREIPFKTLCKFLSKLTLMKYYLLGQGYKDMLVDEQMKAIVPNELVGKEDILFCNLEELQNFHGEKVLPDLCSYILDVGKVANLFVKQVRSILNQYYLNE